jgi:hypothetical protein
MKMLLLSSVPSHQNSKNRIEKIWKVRNKQYGPTRQEDRAGKEIQTVLLLTT